MAKLADGWKIDGPGYGCNVLLRPQEELGHQLIVNIEA
jgi:hypothetical protein